MLLFAAPPAHAGDEPFLVPPDAGRKAESAPFDLPLEEAQVDSDPSTEGLRHWFRTMPPVEANTTFGEVVLQAGRQMLNKPYATTVEVKGQEIVDYNVGVFQCVSFVESCLAMARCVWQRDRQPHCFRQEVSRLRYRHGAIDGYGSRLHYFEDWLADNTKRGSLLMITPRLSRRTVLRRTTYMTDHPNDFPGLQDPLERKRIEDTERRLSHRAVPIVYRADFPRVAHRLRNGDLVAIATRRPDILIHHVGLVDKDSQGVVRLLHASNLQGRVVRTHQTIGHYLFARPEREGVLVARPRAPQTMPVAPGR